MKVKSVDGTREFEWAKNIVEGNKNQRVSNEVGGQLCSNLIKNKWGLIIIL